MLLGGPDPSFSFEEPRDVSEVMAPVPRVKTDVHVEANRTGFRMEELPLQVSPAQSPKEPDPTFVKRLQEPQGCRNRDGGVIGELGPAILEIGFDRRAILGERPLETDEAVQ
jgi:hypothetical protein